MIHLENGTTVPVDKSELPVRLPEDIDLSQSGNPLANHKNWKNTVDKKIIRFVRSYNKPLDGVFDIHNWNELIPLLNSF